MAGVGFLSRAIRRHVDRERLREQERASERLYVERNAGIDSRSALIKENA
jgi:hypothetical protein